MNRSVRLAVASLRKALRAGDWRTHDVHLREALRLLSPPKAAPKKSIPKHLQSSKPERKAAHRMSTKEIRAACLAREKGRCAAEGLYDHGPHAAGTNMDHWLGGSGQRRQRQSVETCWMLCRLCDWRRTNNIPSAHLWNTTRRTFCIEHGYAFQPHVEHAQVKRRRPPSSPSIVHEPVRRPNVG